MWRRIRIVAACLSLALSVGFAYFGVRSFLAVDQLSLHPTFSVSLFFMSGKGRAVFLYRSGRRPLPPHVIREAPRIIKWMQWDEWTWEQDWGRRSARAGYFRSRQSLGIWLPHWPLVLLTASIALLLKPAPRFKFSIAQMLGITTIAAVALGFITLLKQSIGSLNVE